MRPLLFLIILSLTACTAYRPPVQQGNHLRLEQVQAIEVGMTRREVLRVLGHPLLQDPFNADRWDYYYSLDTEAEARVLSLWFADDLLERTNERVLSGDASGG